MLRRGSAQTKLCASGLSAVLCSTLPAEGRPTLTRETLFNPMSGFEGVRVSGVWEFRGLSCRLGVREEEGEEEGEC